MELWVKRVTGRSGKTWHAVVAPLKLSLFGSAL